MTKRLAVLIAALAVVACSDEPTAPEDKAVGGPQLITATQEVVNDLVNAFLPMLEDLPQRVLPALNDPTVGGLLSVHTTQLVAAMKLGNTEGARAAHSAALAVIQEYSARVGDDAVDAADIEVVRLTLSVANEMFGQ
jgi:hypothetical protein